MIKYIPATTEAAALLLTQKLFNLFRPTHIRQSGERQFQNGRVVVHPQWGDVVVPIHDVLYHIHQEADDHEMDELVQPFIDAGVVPVSELVHLQEGIASARGKDIQIFNYLPTYWTESALSEEQLALDGWFDTEEDE